MLCLCSVHTVIYLYEILNAVPWTKFCLPVDRLVDLPTQAESRAWTLSLSPETGQVSMAVHSCHIPSNVLDLGFT